MSRSCRDLSAWRSSGRHAMTARTRGSRTAAIAALTASCASAAIAGCGPGYAAHSLNLNPAAASLNLSSAKAFAASIADRTVPGSPSANTPGAPVRYRSIEYSAAVGDAGTPGGFTAFATVSRSVTIYSSSAASIVTVQTRPLTFTTPSDHQRWVAAGSPALTPGDANQMLQEPPGQFSFVWQGTLMTYRQASDLPGTADAFSAQLLSYLRPFAGTYPTATIMLKQLAYLIAVAPLPPAARSAAWHVAASLPGLRLCGTGTDLSGRRGQGLCADAAGQETEILVNKTTGAVLAIEELLKRPSPDYPTVPGGSLILSLTFIDG